MDISRETFSPVAGGLGSLLSQRAACAQQHKPDGSILIHTQGSSWLLGFQYVFLGFLFFNEILEASLPCRGIIQPWAQNGSKIHIQYLWTSLFSPCPVLRQCRRCRRPTLSPSNASLWSYVLCNYVQVREQMAGRDRPESVEDAACRSQPFREIHASAAPHICLVSTASFRLNSWG